MQTGAFLTENQKQVQEAFYRTTLLDLKESSAVENGKRISIGPVKVTLKYVTNIKALPTLSLCFLITAWNTNLFQ